MKKRLEVTDVVLSISVKNIMNKTYEQEGSLNENSNNKEDFTYNQKEMVEITQNEESGPRELNIHRTREAMGNSFL